MTSANCPIRLKLIQYVREATEWRVIQIFYRTHILPYCFIVSLWGHGYVARDFEGITESVWLKRFRCPDCKGVHTCRPAGYLRSVRYPASLVALCLAQKIVHGRWMRCLCRQLQQYWYKSLCRLSSLQQTIRTPSTEHLSQFIRRSSEVQPNLTEISS